LQTVKIYLLNFEYWRVCVFDLPEDGGVSPQHVAVTKVSTTGYIRYALRYAFVGYKNEHFNSTSV